MKGSHTLTTLLATQFGIPSLITHLFFSRRPANVSFFVVTVVILAIERESLRPRTYLGEELLEGAKAKLDSTASVVFPSGIMWICTALLRTIVSKILASSLYHGRYQ